MHKHMKLISVCTMVFVLCGCGSKAQLLATEVQMESPTTEDGLEHMETEVEPSTEDGMEEVAVYVCGAVKSPGVYYVPSGAIRQTAVLQAGGFLENADQTYVNLAQFVTAGEQIYIPTLEETGELTFSAREETESQGMEEDADATAASAGKVDINTAGKEQLMTLPGIGESKAEAIIAYRDARGRFQSVDELMNVTGIKEGIYNKIKDLIIVG